MLFADQGLSRRLESAEGQSGAAFVEARARLQPQVAATWRRMAGAYVLFDGVGSPITQSFGIGVHQPPTADDLAEIEAFYAERGAAVFHEISPIIDDGTLALLNTRGYHPCELTSVMFRAVTRDVRLTGDGREGSDVRVHAVSPDEAPIWVTTATRGWSEFTEFAPMMEALSRVSVATAGSTSFLAELDGRPVAAGALSVREGVGLLAGASTIPEARRRGAQNALLEARLRHAAEVGCDLAMMCARPGSASQRNAERNGFRIAYTRIKWTLEHPVR
ncbi:MAG: GNAT family N-acetyltransferase [Gemmatimonadaceae bacterium]